MVAVQRPRLWQMTPGIVDIHEHSARRRVRARLLVIVVPVLMLLSLPAASASADPPDPPVISEPAEGGAPLDPADVHMEAAYSDADGDAHDCSDWEITTRAPAEPVWSIDCISGADKAHVHLGDGQFTGSHAGRSRLMHDADYTLRVRFRDETGEWGEWATRDFATAAEAPPGTAAPMPWVPRAGYMVEVFAEDLQLPVDIAMVPEPGDHPGDPLFYVAELYGNIKVVSRDGTVRDYASDLLNFNPTGNFPGSGEKGLAGIAVHPASGDVFASMVYQDESWPDEPKPHYPKVVRFESSDDGLTAIGQVDVLDMVGETQGASHQISNLAFGPDGYLYVHNGDGLFAATARDLDSFRGKILRMTADGAAAPENPFYDDSDGTGAADYVFAYGLRNPFGGAWRLTEPAYYMVGNGPWTDRFAKVVSGRDFLWAGDNETMSEFALYQWTPSHAPVNVAFVEPQTAGGSGFPAEAMGNAFVTESGPTYASGPLERGKRIVELELDDAGELEADAATLVEYQGTGKATAAGLAAGPDGLYFTDLYKDQDSETPIDRGANVLRVSYCGACPGPADEPPEDDDQAPGDGSLPDVEAPPSIPPASDAPERSEAPHVERYRLLRKVFAVARPGRSSAGSARVGRGTEFLYEASKPGAVRIRVRQISHGLSVDGRCRRFSLRATPELRRRAGRRCVLPGAVGVRLGAAGRCRYPATPRMQVLRCRPGARSCVRRGLRGTIVRRARDGTNRHRFSGRIKAKALTPGQYLATIRLRDRDGNRSHARTARFRVVHRAFGH